MAATPFPGLPPFFEASRFWARASPFEASRYRARASPFVALGDDERLSIHPIGVTQHAQRADLELIDSSQREPTDGYLLGFGHRNNRRRPQHPAGALECVPHIEGDS